MLTEEGGLSCFNRSASLCERHLWERPNVTHSDAVCYSQIIVRAGLEFVCKEEDAFPNVTS